MKKTRKIIAVVLAILMALSAISVVSAQEAENEFVRYVRDDASSGASGTFSKPWCYTDLSEESVLNAIHAKTQAETGARPVTVYVLSANDYEGTIVLDGWKGTADYPITIVGNMSKPSSTSEFTENNNSIVSDKESSAPLITIKNCEYVTVKGIDLYSANGDGISIENSSNIKIANVNSYKANQSITKTLDSALTIGNGVKDLTVENCSFSYFSAPIEVAGEEIDNVTIKNCSMEFCSAEALIVDGVDGVSISDLTVTRAFYSGEETDPVTDKAGVVIKNSNDVVLSGGKIATCAGPAIALENVKDTTIEKVFSTSNAAFMTNKLGTDANVRIRYCVSAFDDEAATVISSTEASKLLVYNNTFYGAKTIDMSKVVVSVIANNIFDFISDNKDKAVPMAGDNTVAANCYNNVSKDKGEGSVQFDPWYVDTVPTVPELNNFVIASASKIIGAGIQVEEDMGKTDIFGTELATVENHNIGAYEGLGVESVQPEVDQSGSSTFMYYVTLIWGYVKDILQKIMDKILTPEQQEALTQKVMDIFNWVVSVVTDIVAKIMEIVKK